MDRSCFLKLLLLSMLLLLSFSKSQSQGFCSRKLMEAVVFEESTAQLEEIAETSRGMIEIMDYKDPGPNVNPKTGYIFNPPPQG